MNKEIQRLIDSEKWDKLYNYLKNNKLPLDDLNARYKFMDKIAFYPASSYRSESLLTRKNQK